MLVDRSRTARAAASGRAGARDLAREVDLVLHRALAPVPLLGALR